MEKVQTWQLLSSHWHPLQAQASVSSLKCWIIRALLSKHVNGKLRGRKKRGTESRRIQKKTAALGELEHNPFSACLNKPELFLEQK